MVQQKSIADFIRVLPRQPGVYLFKNADDEIIYIGKAKDLKARVSSYLHQEATNLKASLIVSQSSVLDHMVTENELEAMILEAKLIQRYQPKHNVLLKDGQPFLYIMVTPQTAKKLPQLTLVRNRKKKGVYFGPFIEKSSVRRVFDFLLKTFRLKLCNKKIPKGCLFYHMGVCAGSCRDDFNTEHYLQRLELAKRSLQQGHKKFLSYLQEEIDSSNAAMRFEKSRELHNYYQAFERVFTSLKTDTIGADTLSSIDIWVAVPDNKGLLLFSEKDGVLKKRREFFFGFDITQQPEDYLVGYYRVFFPAATVVMNFDFSKYKPELVKEFLMQWHELKNSVDFQRPKGGHFSRLLRLAEVQAAMDLEKKATLAQALKRMLKLPIAPKTIDCFDISHKQGTFIVGSCIRFTNGKPDKNKFRKFKLKTVHQNDDYASLREIVSRRYKDTLELPDLILIDGGKGQLNAVKDLFPDANFVSLAKREETVFSENFPDGKILNQATYAAQTLIALRDYAHHFAISFHRSLASIR